MTGILAVLASPLFLGGCATVVNLDGPRQIYGGTFLDATVGVACLGENCGLIKPQEHEKFDAPTRFLLGSCATVDLPFSTLGDTLTLPWTLWAQLFAHWDEDPRKGNLREAEDIWFNNQPKQPTTEGEAVSSSPP